ncbi:hypothetical protein BDR05DRAFT_863125, partial [Suillus weaverae]
YEWFADSGTTSHITRGRGTVELESYIGKHKVIICLKNVLYIPSTSNNLVSIHQLDKDGGCAKFGAGKVALMQSKGNRL